jgi:hypothetical protein
VVCEVELPTGVFGADVVGDVPCALAAEILIAAIAPTMMLARVL